MVLRYPGLSLKPLPIDALLPDVIASLRAHPSLVLEAPPGAGKTTRVPAALLDAELSPGREILVLEPRRLAARLAARWVAAERGEAAGETVGYQVRFEEVAGPRTRLRFITEALLVRRLLLDPELAGTGAVIFDELHERHLHTDLSLALVRRLQERQRPDLRIVAMSATLDTAPISAFLGHCPVLRSAGRLYDVEVEHLRLPDARPLVDQVASAVRRAVLEDAEGDVLVFLPGAAEIRRALERCEPLARERELLVLPLLGELPPEQQELAVTPQPRRKVVLATNVAESSVTIDGVTTVIDAGLARIAGADPWSGLPSLRVRPISRASAAQRSGRAGRTRPGRCLRLYTRHDHDTRRPSEAPEILRLDLSETVLLLAALGVPDPAGLGWLDAPPAPALEAARELLGRLQAIDAEGGITPEGRRMAGLPLHPRLGRVVLTAARLGRLQAGCEIAAILGERDLRVERGRARESGPSDVLALRDALHEAERVRFDPGRLRAMGLSPGGCRTAARARDQLLRTAGRARLEQGRPGAGDEEQALGQALLAGFPDRVAARKPARTSADAELLLALGGSARLANSSVVRDAPWLVAVHAEQRDGAAGAQPLVWLASAIDPAWLLDLFTGAVRAVDEVRFNAKTERVERLSRLVYESLLLEESRRSDLPADVAVPVLREAALAAGVRAFCPPGSLEALFARADFARRSVPQAQVPQLGEAQAEEALAKLCEGCVSFAELRQAPLLDAVRARLGPQGLAALERLAPGHVTLPGGRRLRIEYEPDRPPWVASMLQDFFGMRSGPTVAEGRTPLTLHLLAPNRRPVQVTTDLASFWQVHYPVLRRSLSRRYPRHAWPEDPIAARPPSPGGRRRS